MKNLQCLVLCLVLTFAACKKQEPDPTPSSTAVKQSDQQGSSAADGGLDDVNDYISNKIGGGAGKRLSAYNLPCGVVSVDSSTDGNGKKSYAFKYGGSTPCGYKHKSGTISFKLVQGSGFGDKGAVCSVTFLDYTVQVLATGDVIKLNGTLYTTNVNGGYIWQAITNGDTIIHRLRGGFITTYANGDTRPKNYYQLKTWTSASGWPGITFRMKGDTVINGMNVCETGKTVDGNYDYKTETTEDFLWTNCGGSYAGPFVLKNGTARLNASIPNVSPAYFQIEAGYHYTDAQTTPARVNDCNSNAYKITTMVGATTKIEYQLY